MMLPDAHRLERHRLHMTAVAVVLLGPLRGYLAEEVEPPLRRGARLWVVGDSRRRRLVTALGQHGRDPLDLGLRLRRDDGRVGTFGVNREVCRDGDDAGCEHTTTDRHT